MRPEFDRWQLLLPELAQWKTRNTTPVPGVDVFSREFVFGERYIQERLKPMEGVGLYGLLDAVLRTPMTDNVRQILFPRAFDLGNQSQIQRERCTVKALLEEIAEEASDPKKERLLTVRADGLRAVQEGIGRLSRHSFDDHFKSEPRKTLKVAKLLYRFLCRQSHLFSMLELPKEVKAGSLELTNPYPLGTDSAVRWEVCDLRSRLSAEIDSDRLLEIDAAYRITRYEIGEALMRLQAVFADAVNSVEEMVRCYEIVTEQWMRSLERFTGKEAPKLLPLDEQLYIYMLELDFVHFACVDQRLRLQRHYYPQVKCVKDQLKKLGAVQLNGEQQPFAPELHSLLAQAVGKDVSQKVYAGIIQDAGAVLRHYHDMLKREPDQPAPVSVNPELALAAVVFAWDCRQSRNRGGEKNEALDFQPYLHGQPHRSGSVKAAVREGSSAKAEEYERIIRYTVDWVRYALLGQTNLYEAKLALEQGWIRLFGHTMRLHNVDVMLTALSNLRGYTRHGAACLPQRAREELAAASS